MLDFYLNTPLMLDSDTLQILTRKVFIRKWRGTNTNSTVILLVSSTWEHAVYIVAYNAFSKGLKMVNTINHYWCNWLLLLYSSILPSFKFIKQFFVRWLTLASAIARIIDQWLALKTIFWNSYEKKKTAAIKNCQ